MLPSIWYETHLISENFNVSGVSLVGVPMVLVGHNNSIAWGSTLAFTDAEDLFVEQFNPDNPQQYKFKANWLEAEEIEEKIIVKGKPEPHIEKVLITQHGPIISDVVGYTNERIAVNSMALRPSKAITGYWLLNQANIWDEFVEAMRNIDATQLNMTYADIHDNIGYWVTGKVPIRAKGSDGSIPVPGWTGIHEWIGEVPFEEMPHAYNPQDGYLVTCNHKIVPDDYPHHLGNVWMNGYRARRLEEIIEGKTKLSMQDFKGMHMDFKNLAARDFINKIKNIESTDPNITFAINLLNEWDFNLTADSISGTIYEVLRYFIVKIF